MSSVIVIEVGERMTGGHEDPDRVGMRPDLSVPARIDRHDPGDGRGEMFIAYLKGERGQYGERAILMDPVDSRGGGKTRYVCHCSWGTAVEDLAHLSPQRFREALVTGGASPGLVGKLRARGYRDRKNSRGETISLQLRHQIGGVGADVLDGADPEEVDPLP